jgi:nucleotide-binding universal stress UspA family protein
MASEKGPGCLWGKSAAGQERPPSDLLVLNLECASPGGHASVVRRTAIGAKPDACSTRGRDHHRVAIIVGVDGSAESIEALRWALEEGRLRKTPVRAVHVWQYPLMMSTGDPFFGPGFDPLPVEPSEFRALAESRLAAAVAEAAPADGSVEQELLEGNAAEALIDAAKGAELLVVGSRGHGGFAGLLLGSVSHACAQHAQSPVVIIRRKDGS